jgi:hypothetical protein
MFIAATKYARSKECSEKRSPQEPRLVLTLNTTILGKKHRKRPDFFSSTNMKNLHHAAEAKGKKSNIV